MGNAQLTKYFLPHLWREDEPDCKDPIRYHPEFGFEDRPREEKHLKATQAEMDSAGLEPRGRDYCAHLEIEYRGCVRYNAPFLYKCKEILEDVSHCHFEEKIHDMKEFERERRLNARERRIRERNAS